MRLKLFPSSCRRSVRERRGRRREGEASREKSVGTASQHQSTSLLSIHIRLFANCSMTTNAPWCNRLVCSMRLWHKRSGAGNDGWLPHSSLLITLNRLIFNLFDRHNLGKKAYTQSSVKMRGSFKGTKLLNNSFCYLRGKPIRQKLEQEWGQVPHGPVISHVFLSLLKLIISLRKSITPSLQTYLQFTLSWLHLTVAKPQCGK